MSALVVGAGIMGAGIAQVVAQAGGDVHLVDVDGGALDAACARIRRHLERLGEKGRLADDAEVILDRITTAVDRATSGAPFPVDRRPEVAIETVVEDLSVKRDVLARIEATCRDGALIGSNTSSIPITELGREMRFPGRLVGLHFFNPVPRMEVVEVVAGEHTSRSALDRAVSLVGALGKDTVLVRRDVPGFALNRIAIAASNEAIRLVADGVVSAKDVDRGVRGAFGWKMGPLETADLVGLDVVLAARSQIYARSGDPRFEPPALLRQLVADGHLGRKTGRGFYAYEES